MNHKAPHGAYAPKPRTVEAALPDPGLRKGLAYAIATYVMWGFFPLYFVVLGPASAPEVIVHRTVWALFTCLILLVVLGRFHLFLKVIRNKWAFLRLSVAGLLIVTNWTVYVYAVMTDRTIDTALGYFINPLFTVFLALIVLREKLNLPEIIALCLGGVAVIVLVVGMGYLPWIAIVLPVLFGLYSLVKKQVATEVPPLAGMAVETLAMTPVLAAFYVYLAVKGQTSFHKIASGVVQMPELFGYTLDTWQWIALHGALLCGAGVLTMIPLTMLASASQHLSLGLLGILQYISPVLALFVGVVIFGEHMEPARWIGTAIVWLALMVLSFGMWGKARKQKRFERNLERAKARYHVISEESSKALPGQSYGDFSDSGDEGEAMQPSTMDENISNGQN